MWNALNIFSWVLNEWVTSWPLLMPFHFYQLPYSLASIKSHIFHYHPVWSLEEVLSIPHPPSASAPSTKLLVLLLFRCKYDSPLWYLQRLPNFSRNKFQLLNRSIRFMTTWLDSPFPRSSYCLIHCMFQPPQEVLFMCLEHIIFFFIFYVDSLCCFELLRCLELEYWH